MADPARGEVWAADLDPTRDHEQGGRRPVLVVSVDMFNQGPAGLAIVLPITSVLRNIPAHLIVHPPEGGLKAPSRILCDAVRSVSRGRFLRCWGVVSPATMDGVEDRLRILMGL